MTTTEPAVDPDWTAHVACRDALDVADGAAEHAAVATHIAATAPPLAAYLTHAGAAPVFTQPDGWDASATVHALVLTEDADACRESARTAQAAARAAFTYLVPGEPDLAAARLRQEAFDAAATAHGQAARVREGFRALLAAVAAEIDA